jgi:taurine---2-oxoglutarate transaminase
MEQRLVGGPTVAADWAEVEEWDRAYYLHAVQSLDQDRWQGIESAEGNYLHTIGGERLLDFVSQASSDHMGHRDPNVVEGLTTALTRYGHVLFSFATDYRARAAKLIVDDVLGKDDWAGRVRLLATGSESIEAAITMARIFTGRRLVLSQRDSFHGHTAGCPTLLRAYWNRLALPAGAGTRSVLDFPAPYVVEIPRPDSQDCDASQGLPSLQRTAEIIDEVGPENIAAVITETFSGGGLWMSHDDYLPGLRELTRRHGILWIDDEVVCGFGRMGRWFSYQLYADITPDLMVVGKGINGGILPSGGVVASREIGELFERGKWQSRTTWDGHPLVAASICANIETMIEEDVVARAAQSGEILGSGLAEIAQRHPTVTRIAGTGLCYAIELVGHDGRQVVEQDRDFDYTGDLSALPSGIVAQAMAKRGVLVAGGLPNTVKLTPPLRITRDEIEHGLESLDQSLADYEQSLG